MTSVVSSLDVDIVSPVRSMEGLTGSVPMVGKPGMRMSFSSSLDASVHIVHAPAGLFLPGLVAAACDAVDVDVGVTAFWDDWCDDGAPVVVVCLPVVVVCGPAAGTTAG